MNFILTTQIICVILKISQVTCVLRGGVNVMDNCTRIFVENTKKVIKNKGYKQTFIAKKMNITDNKLSDILNFRKTIDVNIVFSLCNALEVLPNELFGYEKSR